MKGPQNTIPVRIGTLSARQPLHGDKVDSDLRVAANIRELETFEQYFSNQDSGVFKKRKANSQQARLVELLNVLASRKRVSL